MIDLCLGVMHVQHIDEGRLKMKTDCPILTDVALRQKALEVLLSYNPTWLRLGLVVVLGPLALLGDIEMPKICSKGAEEVISENALLEVLLEQQFLADAVLAKQHARNRCTYIFQKLNEQFTGCSFVASCKCPQWSSLSSHMRWVCSVDPLKDCIVMDTKRHWGDSYLRGFSSLYLFWTR
jgi:hypothetical protein